MSRLPSPWPWWSLLLLGQGGIACTPGALFPDADADGWSDAEDCRPGDDAVHPGATDPWGDGIDGDCDGIDGVDADGDGWTGDADADRPDCDDSAADAHPGVFWDPPYDQRDTDCDGTPLMTAPDPDVLVSMDADLPTLFGALVSVADVDGDGLADVFVGAPRFNSWRGRVYGFRGVDLAEGGDLRPEDAWWILEGEQWPAAAGAGRDLSLDGDVDGDGVPDLLVMAEDGWPGADAVYIVTGAQLRARQEFVLDESATVIRSHATEETTLNQVMYVDDHDGDGLTDIVLAAWSESRSSLVHVFSGTVVSAAGETSWAIALRLIYTDGVADGQFGTPRWGRSIVGLPDLDGDGDAELAVGTPGGGGVFLYPGGTDQPSQLSAFDGDWGLFPGASEPAGRLGAALRVLDDLDSDGWPELAMGAPWTPPDSHPEAGGGYVALVSTGDLLAGGFQPVFDIARVVVGPAQAEAVGLGSVDVTDLDGDGSPELNFWIGGPVEEDYGHTFVDPSWLFEAPVGSISDVAPLGMFPPKALGPLGGIYDVNGDGVPDMVIAGTQGGEFQQGGVGVWFGPPRR